MPSLNLSPRSPQSDLSNTLSSGAITGIAIGSVAVVIVAVIGIIYLSRHQSAKRQQLSLHIQRQRNVNKTVRDRAGTLVHGEEGGVNGKKARPKIGGMRIGESYYHEMDHEGG
jgi:hypothetical protein